MKWGLCFLTFVLAFVAPNDCCRAGNPIFDFLLNRGVQVAPREFVRLPQPTLSDGMSADEQRKAIEGIPDCGHSWEDLTRKSAVAPFVFKLSTDSDRPDAVGRRIDLWFVAYGSMKVVQSEEFLARLFKSVTSESDPDNSSHSRALTETELARRGLTFPKGADTPRFTASEFTLLDRVHLNATTRNLAAAGDESILSATILDPHFAHDPEVPNQWRPINRDDSGGRTIGPAHPYAGYGAYAKVTRLADPPGAMFIEYHAAFAEPTDWFNGTNLLGSKLPIVATHIVRSLRRGLEKGR
jgi:hypothetical protein